MTVDRCDLCGASRAEFVLEAPNLDGPLVRCISCGLHYVGVRSSGLAFGREPSDQTARRLEDANARFRDLPRQEERRLNALNARWRLERIGRHRRSGRLLEVGCGRGDFLKAARARFEVSGVEPHPELAADAAREGPVHQGLLEDAPWSDFDIVASFHVIEHVDSPSRFIDAAARRLKVGGLLVLETPDIGSWPYRLFRSRWRQFIPEHYYFFDRRTLGNLLERHGFEVRELARIGKYASLGFILNRLGRHAPLLARAPDLTGALAFRVNPGDILLACAVRR